MAIETNSHVADRIRGIASEKRVSRSELATILSVSEMGVSRRLNGKTPLTAEELIKLGRAFSMPVGVFFGEVVAA